MGTDEPDLWHLGGGPVRLANTRPACHRGDLLDDARLQRRGQVVAHTGVDDELRAPQCACGREPARQPDQWIGVTMDDQRRQTQRTQQRPPVVG
jgi:hypothetical protein